MIKLACDPGVNGALAVDLNGKVVVHKCPETQAEVVDLIFELAELARVNDWPIKGIIEKVHSMPGNGVASTWKFACNYATWQTSLIAAKIPFKEVTPQKWMKALGGCPKDKKERKNYIKDKAQKWFPDIKVTLWSSDALMLLTVMDMC